MSLHIMIIIVSMVICLHGGIVLTQQCSIIEKTLPSSAFCFGFSNYWVTGNGDPSSIQSMDLKALQIFNGMNTTLQTQPAMNSRNGTIISDLCYEYMKKYSCYTAYPRCILATYYSAFNQKPCPNICNNVDRYCDYSLTSISDLKCNGNDNDRASCNSFAIPAFRTSWKMIVAILFLLNLIN